MADKVTFRISSAAAPYVGADKPRQERLKAASGLVPLSPMDSLLLVYYLCHDPDPEVKRTAMATMRGFDVPFLSQLLSNRELHPRLLDVLVQLHYKKRELIPLFEAHPMLSEKSSLFLSQHRVTPSPAAEVAAAGEARPAAGQTPEDQPSAPAGDASRQAPAEGAGGKAEEAEEAEGVDETTEEFQSKYQMAQTLGVADKIKMALTGDKEWRNILIKDSNKLVSGSVVKNPRMTEGEVLTIAKGTVQNDEIMRVICANKEWIKNPLIRKALVTNNKTPLPAALRFLATLSEKDIASLAKSKNISTVIATQARRILLSKKEGR